MPQRKSAKDELKKSLVRRERNIARKSNIKRALKTFRRAVESKDMQSSQEALKSIFKTLDKAASKNLIHANKASRKKSRLSLQLNKLQSAASK